MNATQLLERLADRFALERFEITRTWSQLPYLTRWTLARLGPLTMFLHRFQRSDADEPHDHPWPFVSIILAGGYWEHTPAADWANGDGTLRRRWYGPGRILVRPAHWIHRVEIPAGGEAWTLILHGERVRSWGFWCPAAGFVPWKQHLANAEQTGRGCP